MNKLRLGVILISITLIYASVVVGLQTQTQDVREEQQAQVRAEMYGRDYLEHLLRQGEVTPEQYEQIKQRQKETWEYLWGSQEVS